ncbi:hypothetical protein I4F81_009341 [Pyropia yezoensis]|uniref:Uncharacterized protein n=1 Tax=Pyropia yezoensis TaxID=2788 RepID=A0ACC3CA59_PYRYE|nr:hypothetical protein I4F81_009341 [Neopyropia yezoensis]
MHRVKRAAFRPLSRKEVSDEEHHALRAQVTELRRDMERALELLAGAHRAWRAVFRNAAAFAAHTSSIHGNMVQDGGGVKGMDGPLAVAAEATADADAAVGASSKTRGSGLDGSGRGSGSDDERHSTPPGGTAVALTRRVRVWVQEVRAMKGDMDSAAVAEKEAALYSRKVANLEAKLPPRRGSGESKQEQRLARNVDKLEDAEAARDAALDKVNGRMQDAVDDGGGVLEAVVLAYWSLYGDMVVLAGRAGEAGARMVDDRAERLLSRSSSRSRTASFVKLFRRSPSDDGRGRRRSREGRRSSPQVRRGMTEEHRRPPSRGHSRGSSRSGRRSRSGSDRRHSRSGDLRRRSRSGDRRHRSRSGDYHRRSRSRDGRGSGDRRRSGGFLRRLRGKD